MASRLQLQSLLEELLESGNVYYQPPESMKLSYDCIVYSKSDIDVRRANDSMYSFMNRYRVTHIGKRPDSPVIAKLLALPYCSYDRHFVADNLHHDELTLYF